MEAFLPSEIGRLIYGYLFQQCGEGLAEEFLNTCDSMRECRLLKQKYAKNFHHKIQDLSLEDILNQYSVLCSLIFKNATGEEHVHRNILSLLKKVLSSKLGLSGLSSDRHSVAKHVSKKSGHPAGYKTGDFVADKTGDSVTDKSVGSVVDAFSDSVTEADPRRNSGDDDGVTFSPAASDAGDDSSVSFTDGAIGEILPDTTSSNAAKETTAPVAKTPECSLKNISPTTESRICAILCNSASLGDRAGKSDGRVKLPFPAEYCTPRKQDDDHVSYVATPPATDMLKTRNSVSSSIVKTPTIMKSIENVGSKTLPVVSEGSSPAATKCSERLRKKATNEVGKKGRCPQRVTRNTSNKASSILPAVTGNTAKTSVTAVESASFEMGVTVAESTDQPKTTSDIEAQPTTTTLVGLATTETPNVPLVCSEPEVSATETPTTNELQPPVTTSFCAGIPEVSTESVFSDLSFESECSVPSRLDKSASSVRSDCKFSENDALLQTTSKSSPGKAHGISSPVHNPMPKQVEIAAKSVAELTPEGSAAEDLSAAVLPSAAQVASAGSAKEKRPWDLNLRQFVDQESSLDAHITKRKPKDLSNRKSKGKQKEVSKKRKHNEITEDGLSASKRFKSDAVAVVPVGGATNRQLPPVSKSAKDDKIGGRELSPSKRRRSAKNIANTAEPVKKSDQNKKVKSGSKCDTVSKSVNTVTSPTSLNEEIDFEMVLEISPEFELFHKSAQC